VDWVARRVAVNPAVVTKRREPVVVVAGVDRAAAFVVGGAWRGSKSDAANTLLIPGVEKILLRSGSPS